MRTYVMTIRAMAASLALMGAAATGSAQYLQQGNKLVGTGAIGAAQQGVAVAVSADGSTAIVGGLGDNAGAGAAWVYTRVNGVWSQQSKLVVIGAIGTAALGFSVALSADGNTALVGGPDDNTYVGAAWVFTRANGVWLQQTKLVGTGAVGQSNQGNSVSLSADGNTAVVTGEVDDSYKGASWVFTRANGVWSQQGGKLVGAGAVGAAQQGRSVSMSADGSAFIVGGYRDNNSRGAAWIFKRTNGVWSQDGGKLVGSGGTDGAFQGFSVAMSADGNTVMASGFGDEFGVGATWVFTRKNLGWSQQGPKLVGTGGINQSFQGSSIALSADGNTAIICGSGDNNTTGAAWIWTHSNGVWSQRGDKLVGIGKNGSSQQGSAVAISAAGDTAIVGGFTDNNYLGALWVFTRRSPHDFTGESASDILVRASNGATSIWQMSNAQIANSFNVATLSPATWNVLGTGDFNGDGKSDVLWRDSAGNVWMWLMNGGANFALQIIAKVPVGTWTALSTGDFDGDGKADVMWRNANGDIWLWSMNGSTIADSKFVANVPVATWSVVATGDFDGDGNADVMWRNSNGDIWLWFMNGASIYASQFVANVPAPTWTLVASGDFAGEGATGLMWRNVNGDIWHWRMSGATIVAGTFVANVPVATWTAVATGDFDNDGKTDVLWRNTTTGEIWAWRMDGAKILAGQLVDTLPATTGIEAMTN